MIRAACAPLLVLTVAASTWLASGALADGGARHLAPQTGTLWTPHQEWTLEMPGHVGNPFDVVATATFEHTESDARHVTQLFYVGDELWSFRFTGTRTGLWTFRTESDHDPLDGWSGEVHVVANPNREALGFLTTAGTRFAAPVDERGTLAARSYDVYIDPNLRNSLHDYPTDPTDLAAAADAMLDDVEAHGFDALFVALNNNWFAFGVDAHFDHDSVDPSLTTFRVLETLILRAHARGLSVHVWAWGDEERGWTPVGVGGINGEPDRRLQRYIAARLGPLPGWTMSYGFDLHEWVTPEQTRAWWSYLHAHLGWRHLLMARESAREVGDVPETFRFDGPKLDVFSSDERPSGRFYDAAVAELEGSDVPVLFERRFLHTRDGVWDMDTTRRARWQFTLAGEAGAVWGPLWNGGPPYPHPEQLRTHAAFWRDRRSLDLVPAAVDGAAVFAMRDAGGTRTIVYAEETAAVPLELAHLAGPESAVAVDTRSSYAEHLVGELGPSDRVWNAPYVSDWVVAIGFD